MLLEHRKAQHESQEDDQDLSEVVTWVGIFQLMELNLDIKHGFNIYGWTIAMPCLATGLGIHKDIGMLSNVQQIQ